VSADVNSSFEFNCSLECTSDISWSYVSPQHSRSYLLTPSCLEDGRCQIRQNTTVVGQSLNINQVQFSDSGTYLCSSGRKDRPDYCEMSFNFAGKLICILCIKLPAFRPIGLRSQENMYDFSVSTALHRMQTRSIDNNYVSLSVCMSVKRLDCDKTE